MLDEAHLSDVLLDLLGGNPLLYVSLSGRLFMLAESCDAVRDAVTDFLLHQLRRVHAEAIDLKIRRAKFSEVLALL